MLKPARFRPDPEWEVPPSDRDGIVHDEDLDPEPELEWITYEFSKPVCSGCSCGLHAMAALNPCYFLSGHR